MHKIPLYSKNPIYTGLPSCYTKAKGVYIWDGIKKYLDMSYSGIGCNILGYADSYVNYFVKKTINNGPFSTLNPKNMIKLTSLLLAMHPYYQTVRYSKTGGEAMKIALMLAKEKAHDKKKDVKTLFCGYHGWHLKNDNTHNVKELNKIDEWNRPDILVFELLRHEYPKGIAIEVLKRWQYEGTMLICDEITSGFRLCCGGAHQLYGLEPDITVYAKGISNGYPMAVIIGKKHIMESNLWISSTYWTDAIGFEAAYRTIKKLKHCNYVYLNKLGKAMMDVWKRLAKMWRLKIKIGGVPELASFSFDHKNNHKLKTIFIEFMQSKGILATDQFYPNFSIKNKHMQRYIKACNEAFCFVKKHINGPDRVIKNKLEELKK